MSDRTRQRRFEADQRRLVASWQAVTKALFRFARIGEDAGRRLQAIADTRRTEEEG